LSGAASAVVAVASASASSGAAESKTYTRLTGAMPLRPGEVSNTYHRLAIPPGPIAITEFKAEVVEKDSDGNVVPTPLRDAYLHHHVVFSEQESREEEHRRRRWFPMKPRNRDAVDRGFGFGAGTESRGTPQKFPDPYAFVTDEGEDELMANVHVINTRRLSEADAGHCLECPCTEDDVFASNGTILGSVAARRKNWGECNLDLVHEGNDSCFPWTYKGGLLCCEHGDFCLDAYDANSTGYNEGLAEAAGPVSTFYLRYQLTYTALKRDTRPLFLAACCDASGNDTVSGNIEYDIPPLCDKDDTAENEACVHEVTTTQMLHGHGESFGTGELAKEYADREVDVVYMVGHLHRGGLSMMAKDAKTGEVLCESLPSYGSGNEVGDEAGYINGMSTCTFDPPRRMRTSDPLIITGRYDARKAHTGVMSLFYVALAEVPVEGGPRGWGLAAKWWAGGLVVLACVVAIRAKRAEHRRRTDYEAVPVVPGA